MLQPIIESLRFDYRVFLGMVVLFLTLWTLLSQIFWKPILARLASRDKEVDDAHTRVERLRHEMEDLRSDYQTRIVQIEADARTQIQNAIKEAQSERERILREAREQSEALLSQGTAEMERDKTQALVDLQSRMVGIALNAANTALGSRADATSLQKEIETRLVTATDAARN